MTQSPIEPPNNPNRPSAASPDRGPSRPLKFDEMVAVLVAFLTLGSVLFWGLTRSGADSIFNETLSSGRAAIGEVDEGRLPLALGGDGDVDDESLGAVVAPGDREERAVRRSARAELAERAEARRARAGIVRPESTGSMWDDFRTGAAGTAAGVAGIAATSGDAEALPDVEEAEPAEAEAPTPAEETPTATASEAATAEPNEPSDFSDVPDNYWAKPYIDGLSSRGLISGFVGGDFRPDEQVTRAQVANIVSRTFDLTANKDNLEFSDVSGDFWARESIGEVVRGGFMTGFPDETFQPNEPVTRAQALTTLVTGLGIEPPNNVQPTIERYTDKGTIPEWATEKVAAATTGNLVVNYPQVDQINADEPTTRAELSAMIYQALAKEGIVDPIESEYLVKP